MTRIYFYLSPACLLGGILYNSDMIEDIFKIGIYYYDLDIDTKSYVDFCYDIQKKDKGSPPRSAVRIGNIIKERQYGISLLPYFRLW